MQAYSMISCDVTAFETRDVLPTVGDGMKQSHVFAIFKSPMRGIVDSPLYIKKHFIELRICDLQQSFV
jgi:hypothetical protein